MPTPSSKVDIPSSSIKEPKPSSLEPSDHTPTIEKLQQENAQLLQQLEADNEKLWIGRSDDHHILRMKKHRKRPKTKSPGQEGEASKANPPPPSRV
jgi:hypothetical protein